MRAAGQHADLGDEIHAGDRASTESDEPLRIEPSFQIFQAVADRIALAVNRREVKKLAFGDN